MKAKRVVHTDHVIYHLFGTEEEIKDYLRKAPVIPAKTITINTYTKLDEYERAIKK